MTRPVVLTSCCQCPWCAKVTADTEAEGRDFLQKALNTHILDTHAERTH